MREVPWPSHPADYYRCLRHLTWPQWLDSGGSGALARWHLMVAAPRVRVLSEGGRTRVEEGGTVHTSGDDPLDILRQWLGPRRAPPPGELPFAGGAVGYLSYDLGRRLMGLPAEGAGFPELAMGIYDWALVLDRERRRAWLVGDGVPSWLPSALERAASASRAWSPGRWRLDSLRIEPGRNRYLAHLTRIRRYLEAGDCYQINYAHRLEARFSGDPFALYLALRRGNPVPYGALMEFPFGALLCASPEQFLSLRSGRVITRPIKGTRPRGGDAAQDERLAADLLSSEKDRAENLMIVDLLRNDLGKVCRPGSIRVPVLFQVERHPTVHHLVSTVEGELESGRDALDLIRACLPGGSITGAPKRRAMEIIHELEGMPRGIYCGAMGWIGHHGDMETNIAIRTLQLHRGRARYWAGGGIVIDSDPMQEYRETLHKSKVFLESCRHPEAFVFEQRDDFC